MLGAQLLMILKSVISKNYSEINVGIKVYCDFSEKPEEFPFKIDVKFSGMYNNRMQIKNCIFSFQHLTLKQLRIIDNG